MKKILTIWSVFLLATLMAFGQTWQCGDNLTDTRDGKVYKTVAIGAQCWMAENLNFGTMIQNTGAGQLMSDNAIVEKYCWDNDPDYCDGTNGKTKKGAFYEYKEAVQFYGGQPTKPVQGVCPEGWHIPSYNEINDLMVALGSDVSLAYTKMIPGGSSGFDAQQIGYRCTAMGNFRNGAIGTDAVYYWSSDQSSTNSQYAYFMVLDKGTPQVQMWEYLKSLGISVRCIKNTGSSLNEKTENPFEIENVVNDGKNQIKLNFIAETNQEINIQLFDLQGKEILSKKYNTQSGANIIEIEVTNHLQGIYILSVKNNNHITTTKVVF